MHAATQLSTYLDVAQQIRLDGREGNRAQEVYIARLEHSALFKISIHAAVAYQTWWLGTRQHRGTG